MWKMREQAGLVNVDSPKLEIQGKYRSRSSRWCYSLWVGRFTVLIFTHELLLGESCKLSKKGSIRTDLHNVTFFSTIWLVVVDGGAKIRSPKTYVECLNSVSSDTNERRIFLEMFLERTKLKDSEKVYMLVSSKTPSRWRKSRRKSNKYQLLSAYSP